MKGNSMKKLSLLIGGTIGFLLGSRAGRGPYEQVENWARQMSGRPQVQRVTNQVSESARRIGDVTTDTASTAADRAAEATADAVSTATDRVTKTVEDVGERIDR
jgi:hypothetical protein